MAKATKINENALKKENIYIICIFIFFKNGSSIVQTWNN